MLVQQRETSKAAVSDVDPKTGMKKCENLIPSSHAVKDSIIPTKNPVAVVRETQEESITTPSISGITTKTFDESFNPFDAQRNQSTSVIHCQENNPMSLSQVDGKRRVQFSMAKNSNSQGNIPLAIASSFFFQSQLCCWSFLSHSIRCAIKVSEFLLMGNHS